MTILNIFEPQTTDKLLHRISELAPNTFPLWGKMDVAQMLAHCCVAYDQVFNENTPRPNAFVRFMLRMMLKDRLTNSTTPYKKNSGTAPAFLITDARDFEVEKARLIEYIQRVEKLGANYFEHKESVSLGKLNSFEWNNLFYKHLDHHLSQFGV
jgi:Protein of unknown function (DUF1569)